MFNINSRYVGLSRSVRSQEAIESYEVPISIINRNLIDNFLEDNREEFSEKDFRYLKNLSIAKWKYIAKEKTPATSWHHTSSFFNETNHYCLYSIANKAIDIKDTLQKEYENSLKKTKKDINYEYGVILVQVWGGTRKRPRVIDYQEVAGIIIGDWLYYKNNHTPDGSIRKFKTTANKVEWFKTYNSYNDLIKNHKKYKSTKKVFNKLIKEKI